MKILILTNNDLGLYKFRKELIEEFLKQRHIVYISLPDGDLVRPLEEMGCRFIDTPVDRRGINPKNDLKLYRKYKRVIKSIAPDLVITYTIKPNIYGGIAARIAKIPYAVNVTGLGTAFEKADLVRTIVVSLYKIALKKAKVVFFENISNRDEMVKFGCCKTENTCVLNGAGVNTELYSYQPYPRNDTIRFLFIGRVMKEKGIDELFEAMKLLVNEGVKCILDVVGPFEENYKERLEQNESEGWVKYYGYQEDVKPFIRNCDCFVLPSYHEGMANTNLECAASGRPVITSNIHGCLEAVENGATGYLVEKKSVDSLYKAMKKMCELSYIERQNMGIEGRKYMEKKFEKKVVVNETIRRLKAELYND